MPSEKAKPLFEIRSPPGAENYLKALASLALLPAGFLGGALFAFSRPAGLIFAAALLPFYTVSMMGLIDRFVRSQRLVVYPGVWVLRYGVLRRYLTIVPPAALTDYGMSRLPGMGKRGLWNLYFRAPGKTYRLWLVSEEDCERLMRERRGGD